MIHNDFYLGNIIVDGSKIYAIDFDKSGVGHPYMDLASILISFEFPKELWDHNLSFESVSEMKALFKKTYFESFGFDAEESETSLQLMKKKALLDRMTDYVNFVKVSWTNMDKETKKYWTNIISYFLDRVL